jgi:hypothetical protein
VGTDCAALCRWSLDLLRWTWSNPPSEAVKTRGRCPSNATGRCDSIEVRGEASLILFKVPWGGTMALPERLAHNKKAERHPLAVPLLNVVGRNLPVSVHHREARITNRRHHLLQAGLVRVKRDHRDAAEVTNLLLLHPAQLRQSRRHLAR